MKHNEDIAEWTRNNPAASTKALDNAEPDFDILDVVSLNSTNDTGLTTPDEKPQNEEDAFKLYQQGRACELPDPQIVRLAVEGKVAIHSLENALNDANRAVRIRRVIVATAAAQKTSVTTAGVAIGKLPHLNYDFSLVHGCCAENVIGYLPVPVGVVGPVTIDGRTLYVPMSTTEGTLIASTSRGCKAINLGGGSTTIVTRDGMTRAPVVEFENLTQAAIAKDYIESEKGLIKMKAAFSSTTSHGRLLDVAVHPAGRTLYLRFRALTGDAMGMNMISKGVQAALNELWRTEGFPLGRVVALSGNLCTDKKPAAINWIEGRGKSVAAEAILPEFVVRNVLKTTVTEVAHVNMTKNYVGSALAGTSAGGFNAQAANIVTAIFLATGQDVAQAITSSNCLTTMEVMNDGSLYAAVTMPSIEVGVIGGGTQLPAQSGMLELLGLRDERPGGQKSSDLARVIAATVLAGELSLCCALAAGHLVSSHMVHNRR